LVGTSLDAATLHLGAMRYTSTSLLSLVGTSIKAATLHLGAMRYTSTSLLGLIFTSIKAATFKHCAVGNANSSLDNLLGTTLEAAKFYASSLPHVRCTILSYTPSAPSKLYVLSPCFSMRGMYVGHKKMLFLLNEEVFRESF
jgi:hypothetical protein